MNPIRIAIAGVGNCASALVQGIAYYRAHPTETIGLAYPSFGGWRAGDIEVVAAFDIDSRKVGRPIEEAIFALPNNTTMFFRPPHASQLLVQMAPMLDGVPEHMKSYPPDERFEPANHAPVDVARSLRDSGAQMLLLYLPVGSARAAEFYASACLDAGVALINCIPEFIVSNPSWASRFRERGIPCVGDDIKAQVGATITHRTLARMLADRGVRIDRTYQLNTGGNTDFLNMLSRERIASKRISKTEAVQSVLDVPLDESQIHIGPSDYVRFQKDNKVCYLRIEATGFGRVPLNLELRLSVEDSPNSAGVAIDAIRGCRVARDAGLSGPIEALSACTMKHPPTQMHDNDAKRAVDEFIASHEQQHPGRT